ncbi:MAG: hypothetical protein GY809_13855 [Planctomycetes bacterium]|nr:hypothetical protein [Planctomycetota bacterium]
MPKTRQEIIKDKITKQKKKVAGIKTKATKKKVSVTVSVDSHVVGPAFLTCNVALPFGGSVQVVAKGKDTVKKSSDAQAKGRAQEYAKATAKLRALRDAKKKVDLTCKKECKCTASAVKVGPVRITHTHVSSADYDKKTRKAFWTAEVYANCTWDYEIKCKCEEKKEEEKKDKKVGMKRKRKRGRKPGIPG